MDKKIFNTMIEDLPRLAWLAAVDLNSDRLNVIHGSAVECCDKWIVEGVWDGEFELGDFHKSENFFGSGVRVDGDCIYLVASTGLDDRIVYCHYKKKMLFSNSLALLLAYTDSTLDPKHEYKECWAIETGVKSYSREFHVKHPKIDCFYQLYGQNLVIKNGKVDFEIRSKLIPIHSYEEYYDLLKEIVKKIQVNYLSNTRKIPMLPIALLSTGYDSTAVAALVKEIGVNICFNSKYSNSKIPSWINKDAAIDDCKKNADILGYKTIYLDPDSIRKTEDEIYFLSGTWGTFDTIMHSMSQYIKSTSKTALVFKGNYGDKIWDANKDKEYLNEDIKPGGTGGMSLSETRLETGFIQIPVPQILARNVKYIDKITYSEEMNPWRLHNSYDRPIPRRMGENANLPRESFGMRKKAVTQHYYYPKNPLLRKQFWEFLRANYNISAYTVYSHQMLGGINAFIARMFLYLRNLRSDAAIRTGLLVGTKETRLHDLDIVLYRSMFIWAANTLSKKVSHVFKKNQVNDILEQR